MATDYESMESAAPDSLTLGQLKKIVSHFPKPRVPQYDFRYDDSDNLFNELDECYSYVEIGQIMENRVLFEQAYEDDWISSTLSEKLVFIEMRLADLELSDASKRLNSARQLLYIAQGTFGTLSTPEQHLHHIIENNRLLRQSGALISYFNALKHAASVHDYYCRPDLDVLPRERDAAIEDASAEIAVCLTLLYMLIEIFRGDSAFGSEMMNVEPPLPIFLFRFLTRLRDNSTKGFPVKKLLLTLWKSLLGTLGGTRDLERAKKVARKAAGLSELPDNALTKCSPIEYEIFRNEITSKYPAYAPPAVTSITADRVKAPHAVPQRAPLLAPSPSLSNAQAPGLSTPAPSPPPTPGPGQNGNNGQSKTKKQLYQTDPRQPFIFPFGKNSPQVPQSIREAGELYLSHMHVGLDVWHLWKEREAQLANEADKPVALEVENEANVFDASNAKRPRKRGGDEADKQNLARVELIYAAIAPHLQNAVLVLLKLLLAAVTNNAMPYGPDGVAKEEDLNNPTANTVEHVDIVRHREITIKAISAILLLTLKWFKVSHVLKSEYVSQLLLDANCILLILKMFGLQETAILVKTKNESEKMNFFKHCTRNGKDDAKEETSGSAMPPKDESGEVITDFSWRNFFTTINFLRILQKLTKRKTHRILLLVQYKASAILKRMLKVSHAGLQLYVLKILKSQVPFCGRKWRSSNMKVITAIFLNCRPELRDEWIAGADVDGEVDDSLPAEQALRSLVKFYNDQHGYLSTGSEEMTKSGSRSGGGISLLSSKTNANGSLLGFDPDTDLALEILNAPPADQIFPSFDGRLQMKEDGINGDMISVGHPVIPDDIFLDERFRADYEKWLMDEVYQDGSPRPPRSPSVMSDSAFSLSDLADFGPDFGDDDDGRDDLRAWQSDEWPAEDEADQADWGSVASDTIEALLEERHDQRDADAESVRGVVMEGQGNAIDEVEFVFPE